MPSRSAGSRASGWWITPLQQLIAVLMLFCLGLPATAEIYLSEEQAAKIALPNATSIEVQVKQLTSAQRDSLQRASRLHFPEQEYKFFVGHKRDGSTEYAVIMNEIGKEEFITFIVGVNAKGQASEVAVMEYRETRGGEVREKRFTSQFRGKKSSDPIQVNNDIQNYTGATLSSRAIATGVKKALLLTDTFFPRP